MELKEYFIIIKKRLWIVFAITAAFTLISVLISYLVIKPVYQADTSIYVGKQALENQPALAYSDIMLYSQLVKDYRELARSRLVTNTVTKLLKEDDINVYGLSGKVSVNLKNETRFIQITVRDENPIIAKTIADKLSAVFKEKVVELMKAENVQIVDAAQVPVSPVKPNKPLYIIEAFFLGIFVGVGLVFLLEYLDDTIKNQDDAAKYYEYSVIGTIPVMNK